MYWKLYVLRRDIFIVFFEGGLVVAVALCVSSVAHDVLRHRIGLTYEAEASNVTSEEIVSKIINKVEVP